MHMRITKAKVVKTSLDGIEFLGKEKLGTIYEIDLDTIREMGWASSFITGKVWRRQTVWVLPGGWMPTALLEFKQDGV